MNHSSASLKTRLLPYIFSAPVVLFIGILFLFPVGSLALRSLSGVAGGLSLMHYREIFSDEYYIEMMWRTLRLSVVTTLISLLLAYPVALYMRQLSPSKRTIIALILLSPLLTSVVVRTLAWVIVLGPKGVVNEYLGYLGFQPVQLIYNEIGVVIGLTHVFFGYMVLSLMTSMLKIDENLLLAASNLGASKWIILREVYFPLSLPGVLSGSILVFTMSASTYATPVMLGGSRHKMLAPEVYDLAVNFVEWEAAAALSVILFIGIAAIVLLGSLYAESGKRKVIFQ